MNNRALHNFYQSKKKYIKRIWLASTSGSKEVTSSVPWCPDIWPNITLSVSVKVFSV